MIVTHDFEPFLAIAPPERLKKMERLIDRKFGLRIQHILNDLSVTDGYRLVNAIFEPDAVSSQSGTGHCPAHVNTSLCGFKPGLP